MPAFAAREPSKAKASPDVEAGTSVMPDAARLRYNDGYDPTHT
jgi:hypothetical protein